MEPRVKYLHYELITDESVDYNNASNIDEETDQFILKMDKERAVFEMKGNYSSVKEARSVVDNFLERWRVIIGLENDPEDLNFRYKNADFEQIQENGKRHIKLCANVSSHVLVSDEVQLHVSRNKFPKRPRRFMLSPDVITMYDRYRLFRQGKESLTSMAYMCLTVLEASARSAQNYNKNNNPRGRASYQYKIEYDVLNELGRLVSSKGNEAEARKAPRYGVYDPLKPEERDWIVRAQGTDRQSR